MFLWRNLNAKTCAAVLEAMAYRLHGAGAVPKADKPAAPAPSGNVPQKP